MKSGGQVSPTGQAGCSGPPSTMTFVSFGVYPRPKKWCAYVVMSDGWYADSSNRPSVTPAPLARDPARGAP